MSIYHDVLIGKAAGQVAAMLRADHLMGGPGKQLFYLELLGGTGACSSGLDVCMYTHKYDTTIKPRPVL